MPRPLPPAAPTASTCTLLTPLGTVNVCSAPVKAKEQLTVYWLCEQFDGRAALAELANAIIVTPNAASSATTARGRPPARRGAWGSEALRSFSSKTAL
jgi:hypothetical protein